MKSLPYLASGVKGLQPQARALSKKKVVSNFYDCHFVL